MWKNISKSESLFKVKNILPNIIQSYHSKNGVYGYRFKPTKYFEVSKEDLLSRNNQSNIYRWVEAYRKHGHRLAVIDPVKFDNFNEKINELQPEFYGIKPHDKVTTKGIFNTSYELLTVKELEKILKQVYCGYMSAEFSYIESEEEKEWISNQYENLINYKISKETKINIAKLLIKCQTWDNFLAKKFPTVKRYGAEGAENILTFFHQLFQTAAEDNLEHIVLAMPHRGRGNLMTIMFEVRPAKIFKKFRGGSEFPADIDVMGDVVSHYQASEELNINGKKLRISMLRNPSHLEAINPVSMGKTRSKQQTFNDGAFSKIDNKEFSTSILNIQLHGDAAFSGQGINQECLMLSNIPHYEIGGTIHMIVNNQIGFTTPGYRGRSSRYATDLAKCINAPVFHVNGDDPNALSAITKLAFDYQRKFRKDVFIDLNCFRRWGHNELDDPNFTNPLLYSIINNRKSVPDLYTDYLIKDKILTKEDVQNIISEYLRFLDTELKISEQYVPEPSYFQRQWSGIVQAKSSSISYWDTGIDNSLLSYIGETSVYIPNDFNIHPHLHKTHVKNRLKRLKEGHKIDWATAEALAFGSLMYQGHNVRLSGEDVGRGTFSHRHVMLVDQKTNEIYIPLNTLKGNFNGKLEIANSILSEEAVLGFEYGMAIDNPNNLIIWEAQFGDFFNGAQIIIDNFIASGETKWMECNGLVMMLPHGYDGAASEHSSCRMERFLQLTDSKETSPDGDNVNLHIINPTTPAQYFHALRRQIIRNFRKPLIIVAPKILLRLSDATSSFNETQPGTHYKNLIGDEIQNPNKIKKIIICCGKHYYNLNNERLTRNIDDTAIIRLETICPFPIMELQTEIERFKNAKKFIWSQEEARNMGAWNFIRPRFEFLIGKHIEYCGRNEAATPATGDGNRHKEEAKNVVQKPFLM